MINEAFHNICPIFCRPIWHRERGNLPRSFFSFILTLVSFHLLFRFVPLSFRIVFLKQATFSVGSENSQTKHFARFHDFSEMFQNLGRGSLDDWCKRLNGGSSCDLSTRQSTEDAIESRALCRVHLISWRLSSSSSSSPFPFPFPFPFSLFIWSFPALI